MPRFLIMLVSITMEASIRERLIEAEKSALPIFDIIEKRGILIAGKSESRVLKDVSELFWELFRVKKFWHKSIVRAGKNTLCSYGENPPDLLLQEGDILFLDFGPVFGEWEADIGKTFIVGAVSDSLKLKLQKDTEAAWLEGREFYNQNRLRLTGADYFEYTKKLTAKYGWQYGGCHCGHLVGKFPHEELVGEERVNYLHSENGKPLAAKDRCGNERHWIYEMHFVDRERGIGAFYERLL